MLRQQQPSHFLLTDHETGLQCVLPAPFLKYMNQPPPPTSQPPMHGVYDERDHFCRTPLNGIAEYPDQQQHFMEPHERRDTTV